MGGGQKVEWKSMESRWVGGSPRRTVICFQQIMVEDCRSGSVFFFRGLTRPAPEGGGGFTGYAIAADPTRDLSSIEECGGELRSFGAS